MRQLTMTRAYVHMDNDVDNCSIALFTLSLSLSLVRCSFQMSYSLHARKV